jgi:DNA-directed RNA polymerase specialized sigma54-like protein
MLAAALLNHADDEGFFNANARLVKAQCVPLREDSVSHAMLL